MFTKKLFGPIRPTGNRALIYSSVAAAIGCTALAVIVVKPHPAASPTRLPFHPPVPAAITPPVIEPDRPVADPDATWTVVAGRLKAADEEAFAVIEEEMKRVDELFVRAKEGLPAFAGDVVSLEAKARMGLGGTERGLYASYGWVSRQVGFDPFGWNSGPEVDRFRDYVRERFEAHVLETGSVDKTVKAAIAACSARFAAIEAKLLVDLRADLPEGAVEKIGLSPSFGDIPVELDAAIDRAIAGALADIVPAILKEVAAQAVAWLAAGALIAYDPKEGLKQLGERLAIGLAADFAVQKAAGALGYDPRDSVIEGTARSLDDLRSRVLGGSAEYGESYVNIFRVATGHLDPEIRRIFGRLSVLADGDEGVALGLKLAIGQQRHASARCQALRRAVFGATTPDWLTSVLPEAYRDLGREAFIAAAEKGIRAAERRAKP